MTDIVFLLPVLILLPRSIKIEESHKRPYFFYMKKIIVFILTSLSAGSLFSQDDNQNTRSFQFCIGFETRVTPVYLKRIPDVIGTPDQNILEEPDAYLSGPAFFYSLEKFFSNVGSIAFSQQVRYDMIYKSLPLNNQQPGQYFTNEERKTVITDLYLDVFRTFKAGRSKLKAAIGIGIGGLGTKYLVTHRFLSYSNQDIYITTQKNFVYPLLSAGILWSRGNFGSHLKMVYVWDNPTLYDIRFLQPQAGISYRIF